MRNIYLLTTGETHGGRKGKSANDVKLIAWNSKVQIVAINSAIGYTAARILDV